MIIRLFLLLICTSFGLQSTAQQVSLKALLNRWQQEQGLEYSGRNDLLEACLVSEELDSINQLNEYLPQCKLQLEQKSGVYVFSPKTNFFFTGVVIDTLTGLPIENVAVEHDGRGTLTNEYGQFMTTSETNELNVSISHITYGDVVEPIVSGSDNRIMLRLQNFKLNEVAISAGTEDSSDQDGLLQELLEGGRPVEARFYRSLDEALESEHDTVINTMMTARKKRFGIFYHRLDVDRKQGKEVGKVYGFSDGYSVYINPKTPRLRKRTDFYKVEQIDRFLHYKVVERITFPVAGAAPAVIEFPAEKLLDTETGKSKTLTRGRLRKLIADDAELLAAFNQEKRKSKKLKLCLETYYERKQQ